jgi:hypothetical protein
LALVWILRERARSAREVRSTSSSRIQKGRRSDFQSSSTPNLASNPSPRRAREQEWRTNSKSWGRCKGKLPLSVFLVINDNPYGLIFSLSFLWRNCSEELLEVHLLDSRLWCHEDKDLS